MNIKDLVKCDLDLEISGISDDSRKIKKNFLFVATHGYYTDHLDYVSDAIKNGCSCIVSDKVVECDVPVIKVCDVNKQFVSICNKYYKCSPDDFSIIGITGTDGKTTTTSIIKQLLDDSFSCGLIGTNGIYINDKFLKTNNTTPCISEMYKGLKFLKNEGCNTISMEVSSEALLHDRVNNFKFDIIGYTNITEDHLNVHKTVDNYIKCKEKLIKNLKGDGICIINGDDKNCKMLKCKKMYTYGFDSDNDYVISNVNNSGKYVQFCLKTPCGNYVFESPLTEKYNIYNVVLAIIVCLCKGVSIDVLLEKVKCITTAPGRGEHLDFGQSYELILDYAHTYNGIKNILNSVSKYNRIITLTGCAGGREREKRSKIGSLIMEKSDVSIFTMDDPRWESVDDIIDDMACEKNNYIRIIDREEAINYALSIAKDGDVVLILGKGRDTYMAIGNDKVYYCDYDTIESFFSKQKGA